MTTPIRVIWEVDYAVGNHRQPSEEDIEGWFVLATEAEIKALEQEEAAAERRGFLDPTSRERCRVVRRGSL